MERREGNSPKNGSLSQETEEVGTTGRDGARESRIDFIISNSRLTQAIKVCYVDHTGDFPTHKPLVEVQTEKLVKNIKELQSPTNFAEMMEEKIQAQFEKKKDKARNKLFLKAGRLF